MRRSRRYLIRGNVQGVGFRFFAQAAASREGLSGWVRNTSDGSVEVAAEGESGALERFERLMSHGPPRARVMGIDVSEDVPGESHTGFHIR